MKLETAAAVVPQDPLSPPDDDVKGIFFDFPDSGATGAGTVPTSDSLDSVSTSSTTNTEQRSISPPSIKPRTAQACDKCRERKTKCSGERPTCMRCFSRGLICHYTARIPRARGTVGRTASHSQGHAKVSLPQISPPRVSALSASRPVPDLGPAGTVSRRPYPRPFATSPRTYKPYPSLETRYQYTPSSSEGSIDGYSTSPPFASFDQTYSSYSQTNSSMQSQVNSTYGSYDRAGPSDGSGASYACPPAYAPSIRGNGQNQWSSSYENGGFDNGGVDTLAQPRASVPVYPSVFSSDGTLNVGQGDNFNNNARPTDSYYQQNTVLPQATRYPDVTPGTHDGNFSHGLSGSSAASFSSSFFDFTNSFNSSRCAPPYIPTTSLSKNLNYDLSPISG
ncbi:hypothetical protein CC1G_01086 [Coprinopsis cinerea okayama7|uniref:Zn(2)-C6 fungal-type domain-containing protein n=1 Tax=Coprinopsis cinerea (strain Okayama-7 / 130 / ATCC MYA-4618 / FGSC 9003) TaxID=240176 RepID=A8NEH0_COPC7|nr:hypothetical protein CC1G_01086 [Coprinopsis cinerea okayama7\|eukprot:XP_001833024.2 hypothetical protein CC1G_01086 [Coprinopsis cinerea okayama7\